MGKGTVQKDAIKDITSDSQVNSYFPYRWSASSLTFNIYFYLFLYLYVTRITINNGTPHLKSTKNQNRRAALGWPAGGEGGFNYFAVDQSSPLVLLWFIRQNSYNESIILLFYYKAGQRAKWAAYTGGHNANKPQTNR